MTKKTRNALAAVGGELMKVDAALSRISQVIPRKEQAVIADAEKARSLLLNQVREVQNIAWETP